MGINCKQRLELGGNQVLSSHFDLLRILSLQEEGHVLQGEEIWTFPSNISGWPTSETPIASSPALRSARAVPPETNSKPSSERVVANSTIPVLS